LTAPISVAAIAAVTVVATNLVDFELDTPRVALLNANDQTSWSHIATAGALAIAAVIAILTAMRPGHQRALWGPVAGVLALLFVVEVSSVHVIVDRHSFGKLIYLPLLAVLVLCLWRLTLGSEQARFVGAAILVLMLAYVVHVFGARVVEALGWGAGSWVYQVKVGIKEGAELAGWLLLIAALTRMSRVRPPAAGLDIRLGIRAKLARWTIGSRIRRG
jgi:uncharacterized membrane protein YfbV (UPF0208 family)